MHVRALALTAAVAFTVACGSSPTPTSPPPTPVPEPVTWTKCPLHTEGNGPDAECATMKVPLRREDPTGKTIDVFVKRFHPAGGKSARALWMLQGGPGGSGYVFENLAEVIATKYPDVDYYMPDHRGTGLSTKITCKAQDPKSPESILITDAEWPACIDEVKATWGADLAAFSTTNAASDLGLLIERTRTPGQPVFVYGVSYGSYWAHRYLQLFPKQADGVVLDSIAAPGMSLARQDEDENEAARDFFEVCRKDATCAAELGPDPWARAQSLVTKLGSGHCPGLVPPVGLDAKTAIRRALGSLLMSAQFRAYIPAIVLRADRCSESDVGAMNHFFQAVFPASTEQAITPMLEGWGWVLSNNVALSEMWETPEPTPAALAAIRDGAVASRDVTTGFDPVMALWPRYAKDAYADRFATTDTPILMLAGGLDPATLLRKARVMKDHFKGPGQYWIEVPTASHTVIASSATSGKRSCGTMMMMSFLEDPKKGPDTSCLADVVPIDFDGDPKISLALFGSASPWN